MTDEEKREQVIAYVADLMRAMPFTVECKVKKNPKGMKIIYEVTPEEMETLMGGLKRMPEVYGMCKVEANNKG